MTSSVQRRIAILALTCANSFSRSGISSPLGLLMLTQLDAPVRIHSSVTARASAASPCAVFRIGSIVRANRAVRRSNSRNASCEPASVAAVKAATAAFNSSVSPSISWIYSRRAARPARLARQFSKTANTSATTSAASESRPWLLSAHGQKPWPTVLLPTPAARAGHSIAAPLHGAIAPADPAMVRATPGLARHARVADRPSRGKAQRYRAGRRYLDQEFHRALPRTGSTCSQSLAYATEAGAAGQAEGATHGR